VLGFSKEEIIGRNWFDGFIPPSISEAVRSAFGQLIRGELEPVEYFENPVLVRSGEQRMIAWHNAVLRDGSGSIIGTLSSGEDVTEENVAQECLAVAEELTGSRFGFIDALNEKGLLDVIAISDPGWGACRMPRSEALIKTRDMAIRGIYRSVVCDGEPLISNDTRSTSTGFSSLSSAFTTGRNTREREWDWPFAGR
jgi:PAS domain S-box-containing protein